MLLHALFTHLSRGRCLMWVVLFVGFAARADYPVLTTEISSDHPLFVFPDTRNVGIAPAEYAAQLAATWAGLPEEMRPYSVLQIDTVGGDIGAQHTYYTETLQPLQASGLPVIVRACSGQQRPRYGLAQLEELLSSFTTIAGVEASGLRFDRYDMPGAPEPEIQAHVQWLIEIIDIAARYGRFVILPLDRLDPLRIMSNENCAPLYMRMATAQQYIIPVASQRGDNIVQRNSALMGLWLEEASAHWGISADARWYEDADFLGPGVFGDSNEPIPLPGHVFRAMVLNGAMTGATVYRFAPEDSLWFGASAEHWPGTILPTLRELLSLGIIARREFVQEAARVAYKLPESGTPADLHAALKDLDPVHNAGILTRAAYGAERPGQIPELVLNRGDQFWIPYLSAYAPEAITSRFRLVQPGQAGTAEEWRALLEGFSRRAGEGTATMLQAGRGLFIMNSRENILEGQTFAIPALPAPVVGMEARREGASVVLSWPFREGDVSYTIHRRIAEEPQFHVLARGVDERSYSDVDVPPDTTVAYAVTALTSEKSPYAGVVNWGEYLALSTVESRIAEEALLTPVLTVAASQPRPAPQEPVPGQSWWPTFDGVSEVHLPHAQAIAHRIEAFDAAFLGKRLDELMEIYDTEYQDPQGWQFQYVRRAFQWFFERYISLHVSRQLRSWDFSAFDTGGPVKVTLFLRLSGNAISDSSGMLADIEVQVPRENAEITLSFVQREGVWRIVRSEPALPNLADILSYSSGPFDSFRAGFDVYPRP